MKRRDFIHTGILTAISGSLATPALLANNKTKGTKVGRRIKNIIFMVSDGMSSGTLNMADILLRQKEGRGSAWIDLYRSKKIGRALMDTASADSLVTDSAAASSAWGGGQRVKNGALNVNADGSFNKPILQKFKESGKAVGCVTTVPVTHATPAGFCVNMKHRNMQDKIASAYLDLRFDVMMGGGLEYFDGRKREDKRNILTDFAEAGFYVALNKDQMLNASGDQPTLGVFYDDGLPFERDMASDDTLKSQVPTLAAMTQKAIGLMKDNPNGFVLQVEGGKVDWAAHANDTTALLYDQIAFDDAVAEAIRFAESDGETLVVITTDHGNANPGLIKSDKVDQKFASLFEARHTNEWVLFGTRKKDTPARVIERIEYAQNIVISEEEAKQLLRAYSQQEDGLYNAYNLPFEPLARIQQNYTSVGWSGMNHSGDYVELAMYGPGSESLPPFVKNYQLHNFLLERAMVSELTMVDKNYKAINQ